MKITDDMLTEWFPNHVRPERVGLYEVHRPVLQDSPNERTFMRWTGTHWTYQNGSYTDFGKPYVSEDKSKWRGLRKEAKEKHHG